MIGSAVVALGLLFVASASAWRHPSAHERGGIVRVAKRTPHAGTGKVHVSHIRVSTVGPWASADVTIFIDHSPDTALDVLHFVHDSWRLTKHSPGTEGVWCGIGMPRSDQRSLGFARCPRP